MNLNDSYNIDHFVDMLKNERLIIMIENYSEIVEKDEEGFEKILLGMINQMKRLKIVLVSDKKVEYLKKLNELQLQTSVYVGPLGPKESTKLMF